MGLRWLVALALSTLSGACAAGDAGRAVVRDSAGVEIVENTRPRWAEGEGWRLSEQPDVVIGMLEGPPEQQLFRVNAALRLEDGTIVLANGGTQEIRFFGARGEHLSTVGRAGDGPGEFRGLGGLFAFGPDSLLAFDFNLRRIQVLSAAGTYARTVPLPSVGERSFPAPVGTFGDGSLLVRGGVAIGPADVTTGRRRDPVTLFRITLDGAVIDTLDTLPGAEAFVQTFSSGAAQGMMVSSIPFGRAPSMNVSGDAYYAGAGDSYEIRQHGMDGALQRVIRLDRANRPVTPDDVQRMKEQRLASARDENTRRRIESSLAEMPLPETMPAFASVMADAAGNLWVQEFRAPGEQHTSWLVFDGEGRLLGSVQGPEQFNVFDIGRDYVLGRRTDELDVEKVELYRIIRTED